MNLVDSASFSYEVRYVYKLRIEEPSVDALRSIERGKGACISEHLASVLVIGAELITALLTVPSDDSSEDSSLQTPFIIFSYLAAQLWQLF